MSSPLLELTDGDLAELAAALRGGRLSPPFMPVSVQHLLPVKAREPVADHLRRLAEDGFGPPQLATLLDLLIADRSARARMDDLIDVVTTGPVAPGIANRDTGVVVRDLFAGAERSVLVVGYAVYQGRQVFRTLADRMAERPGLKVRLCLDVRRQVGDDTAPDEIVRRFATRLKSTQWPPDRPIPAVVYDPRGLDPSPVNRASLHAKCVVVDGKVSFVSSANFTEAAQERNIEVGLLIHSPSLARRLSTHFDALIAERLLLPLF